MAIYVETQTDPFEQRRRNLSNEIRTSGREPQSVRRPLRGIQIKEDKYATIRVANKDGTFMNVIDSAGRTVAVDYFQGGSGKGYTETYANFIMQTAVEQRSEKSQIVETFGDTYIFFYGESPRILQVQGFLLNTADFNWRAEFWENYDQFFRGTKLAETGSRLYLMYDDLIIEGYLLGANATEQSEDGGRVIPFNFSIFITGYTNVSNIGATSFPSPTGGLDYTQISSYDQALAEYEGSRNLQRASYVDAVRKANRSGKYLGSARLIADAIRNQINEGSDVSIAGFLQRSSSAVMGLKKLVSSQSGTTVVQEPVTRSKPLRSEIRDNTDEFIGATNLTASELAAPLSMADKWLAADQAIDNGIMNYFNPTKKEFFDLMGRTGRVVQEIKARGGNRGRLGYRATASSLQLASMPLSSITPASLRSVPFGIATFEGVL